MIDWLRRSPRDVPQVEVAGRILPLAIRRTASARISVNGRKGSTYRGRIDISVDYN